MKVIASERHRVWIHGMSGIHLTDVIARFGRGWCSCKDWQIRRRRRNELCKHLRWFYRVIGRNTRQLSGEPWSETDLEIGQEACRQIARQNREGKEETDP